MRIKNTNVNSVEKYDIPIEKLKSAKILITGATGLIGSVLTKYLLSLNELLQLEMQLLLLVRDKTKLESSILENRNHVTVKIIHGDILELPKLSGEIDYIIHGASITVSKMMIENPVEVVKTNIDGTINMLELSRRKNIKSMLYLSTMEVYGFTEEEKLLTENDMQYLNPLAIRSSYPESKRMAENLCVSYASEYGVPVKIIRLAQTFGRGVKADDTRVFAEFARCARDKRNICLLTDGESRRMYLDTEDAVRAILTVLLKGNNGEAYNAANKNTYCSIYEMAKLVSSEISKGIIEVQFDANSKNKSEFPPPHRLLLDVTKLETLGWQPTIGLKEMYVQMLKGWELDK